MCLESATSRRCRAPLPMLHIADSSACSSSEPGYALPPRVPARNCRPEIFTFDVEAVQAGPAKQSRRGTLGPRSRRPRRVLYPAKVRKYLPAPETDRPLRWLYMLCLLVFVQVCYEEALPEDDQLLTTVPSMVSMGDLHILGPPLHMEPPIPPTNYSQGAQVNDTTLSWLMHQR